jgi:hypothetical protein
MFKNADSKKIAGGEIPHRHCNKNLAGWQSQASPAISIRLDKTAIFKPADRTASAHQKRLTSSLFQRNLADPLAAYLHSVK